jgi:hypothetical protein
MEEFSSLACNPRNAEYAFPWNQQQQHRRLLQASDPSCTLGIWVCPSSIPLIRWRNPHICHHIWNRWVFFYATSYPLYMACRRCIYIYIYIYVHRYVDRWYSILILHEESIESFVFFHHHHDHQMNTCRNHQAVVPRQRAIAWGCAISLVWRVKRLNANHAVRENWSSGARYDIYIYIYIYIQYIYIYTCEMAYSLDRLC